MTKLAFCDTETTGLDPGRHQIWEVAIITAHADNDGLHIEDTWQAFLPVDLGRGDPGALRMNRYYDRHPQPAANHLRRNLRVDDPAAAALQIARRTAGRHLAGANPAFDARFLDDLLAEHHLTAAWHHRLIDVEAYAAGHLCHPAPLGLADTARHLDIPVDAAVAHTALGDAELALAVYHHILTGPAAA